MQTVSAWSAVVLLLFVTSFGLSSLIFLLSVLLVIVLAVASAISSHAEDMVRANGGKSSLQRLQQLDFRFLSGFRLPVFGTQDAQQERKEVVQQRMLTGYPEIDHELNQVIHLFIRNHVKSWYHTYISHDCDFPKEVDSFLRTCIRVLSCRVRLVDKVFYFTTKLVDDFASHIRLYRLAIEKQADLKLEDPDADLVSLFFDLELQMEDRKVCRDLVSTSPASLFDYLRHVVDVVMFLILPVECFNNRPIRLLLRSVISNSVVHPLIHLCSDPDQMNQLMIWLCQQLSPTPSLHTDSFLTIVRISDSLDELTAVKQLVDEELTVLRSRDTGGDDDFDIKQQINSLTFLDNLITSRMSVLREGMTDMDQTLAAQQGTNEELKNFSGKLINLPFEVVIKNNVALSHFIEFMSGIGSQGYVFFYLNVEGFRVSAEQVVSSMDPVETPDLEFLRCTAVNIYDTYLSPEKYSSQKLELDAGIVQRVASRLKSDPISEDLFDESCNHSFVIMRDRETFYPAFQKSMGYIKMLQDLDLFREPKAEFGESHEEEPFPDYIEFENLSLCTRTAKPWIAIEIDSTGIVREFGHAHAVYAITVSVRKENGTVDRWCSLRRYSDFFTFHSSTIDKFPLLSRLQLPAKRTLSNNLTQEFLEQRRHMLNSYLQQVIRILMNRKDVPGFKDHVLRFLEPGSYDEKEKASQVMGKAMEKLVLKPFKSVGEAVRLKSGNLRQRLSRLQDTISSKSFAAVPATFSKASADAVARTGVKRQ